jgi:hypothetical protein
MRSFDARGDTRVVDEPLYAAYLAETGLQHPLREEVLASQPNDWRDVIVALSAPLPRGLSIQYEKHMTHHMLPSIGRGWLYDCRNAFLIRDPAAVLASYVRRRSAAGLSDIGVVQQRELFGRVADQLGHAPPVIDGAGVLADPAGVLSQLCAALASRTPPRCCAGRRDGARATASGRPPGTTPSSARPAS